MESQGCVANGRSSACEAVKKPAKTADACRHHAHCSLRDRLTRAHRRELNIESAKATSGKQARSTQVICKPAQLRFVLREQAVDKRTVRTGPRHHHKIPSARVADELTNGNGARFAPHLLERGLAWVE